MHWLLLAGWHGTSRCISKYCAAFCCSAETVRVYDEWSFPSIINAGQDAEALARGLPVSRCVVLLGEGQGMAETSPLAALVFSELLQPTLHLFFIFAGLGTENLLSG